MAHKRDNPDQYTSNDGNSSAQGASSPRFRLGERASSIDFDLRKTQKTDSLAMMPPFLTGKEALPVGTAAQLVEDSEQSLRETTENDPVPGEGIGNEDSLAARDDLIEAAVQDLVGDIAEDLSNGPRPISGLSLSAGHSEAMLDLSSVSIGVHAFRTEKGPTERSMISRINDLDPGFGQEPTQGNVRPGSGFLRLPEADIIEAIQQGGPGPFRIRVDGLEYGPTDFPIILALVEKGIVSAADEIARIYSGTWQRLEEHPLFISYLQAPIDPLLHQESDSIETSEASFSPEAFNEPTRSVFYYGVPDQTKPGKRRFDSLEESSLGSNDPSYDSHNPEVKPVAFLGGDDSIRQAVDSAVDSMEKIFGEDSFLNEPENPIDTERTRVGIYPKVHSLAPKLARIPPKKKGTPAKEAKETKVVEEPAPPVQKPTPEPVAEPAPSPKPAAAVKSVSAEPASVEPVEAKSVAAKAVAVKTAEAKPAAREPIVISPSSPPEVHAPPIQTRTTVDHVPNPRVIPTKSPVTNLSGPPSSPEKPKGKKKASLVEDMTHKSNIKRTTLTEAQKDKIKNENSFTELSVSDIALHFMSEPPEDRKKAEAKPEISAPKSSGKSGKKVAKSKAAPKRKTYPSLPGTETKEGSDPSGLRATRKAKPPEVAPAIAPPHTPPKPHTSGPPIAPPPGHTHAAEDHGSQDPLQAFENEASRRGKTVMGMPSVDRIPPTTGTELPPATPYKPIGAILFGDSIADSNKPTTPPAPPALSASPFGANFFDGAFPEPSYEPYAPEESVEGAPEGSDDLGAEATLPEADGTSQPLDEGDSSEPDVDLYNSVTEPIAIAHRPPQKRRSAPVPEAHDPDEEDEQDAVPAAKAKAPEPAPAPKPESRRPRATAYPVAAQPVVPMRPVDDSPQRVLEDLTAVASEKSSFSGFVYVLVAIFALTIVAGAAWLYINRPTDSPLLSRNDQPGGVAKPEAKTSGKSKTSADTPPKPGDTGKLAEPGAVEKTKEAGSEESEGNGVNRGSEGNETGEKVVAAADGATPEAAPGEDPKGGDDEARPSQLPTTAVDPNEETERSRRVALLERIRQNPDDASLFVALAESIKRQASQPPDEIEIASSWAAFERVGTRPTVYRTKSPDGTAWDYIPEHTQGPTWRADYAFYQLCSIIDCGFEVPKVVFARISEDTARTIGGAAPKLPFKKGIVNGLLRQVPADTLPFPIEYTKIWRNWLSHRTKPEERKQAVTAKDLRSADPQTISYLTDNSITVNAISVVLANMLSADYLVNNFGRFARHKSEYGAHVRIVAKSPVYRVISTANNDAFQARESSRVRGRFRWTDVFGRAFVHSIRKLEPSHVGELLFPNSTRAEKVVLGLFWEQRTEFLSRVDGLVKRYGEEEVLLP